jgi:hypothetical protein
VHAERLVHKLTPVTPQQVAAQEAMRSLIWAFYADLKALLCGPIARQQTSKDKHFFFEKKKQKTFVPSPLPQIRHAGNDAQVVKLKVFWFFFSKKNCLSSFTRLPCFVLSGSLAGAA